MLTHLVNRWCRPALSHPRSRADERRPMRLRPHVAARPLHRPHRRHADRARGERLSVRRARSGQRIRPAVSGVIMIRPRAKGVRQEPPLPVSVEMAPGAEVEGLAERIRARLREKLVVTTEIELAPPGSLPRSNTNPNSSKRDEEDQMQKLQTQGLHHVTLVGADRRTSIHLGGRAWHALHLRAAQSRQRGREPFYFDPGDGRLITVFSNEDRKPLSAARRPSSAACTTSPSTSRAPSGCRRSSGSTRAGSKRRARPDVQDSSTLRFRSGC